MKKVFCFVHTDLDGVGCAVLAYLAFGRENVDVEYCDYKNIDEKVVEFVENEELFSSYDRVFITDISVSEDTAELIKLKDIPPRKVRLFDHHPTALWLNKYEWCEVKIENSISGIKYCGTKLFFNYLVNCDYFLNLDRAKLLNIVRFAQIVRDYDTWRWKEIGEEGLVSKQLNNVFDILGRDTFIDWVIDAIRFDGEEFPYFDGTISLLLDQKQKDIDIYVDEKNKQLQVATDQFGKTFGWVFAERYFSELGNRLCELHPEIVYVAMIDISKGAVSFRSARDDVDLAGEIAHSLGGGGHKKAAGSRFDAGKIGKQVSWIVLNMKPNWSDIMPQYIGEPIKKED